jgi:hypothetical protein
MDVSVHRLLRPVSTRSLYVNQRLLLRHTLLVVSLADQSCRLTLLPSKFLFILSPRYGRQRPAVELRMQMSERADTRCASTSSATGAPR